MDSGPVTDSVGTVVEGWLGRGTTILHCTHTDALPHHHSTSASFLLILCLLCAMISRVFYTLLLLAFGQDVQLSMAAVRASGSPIRNPFGRVSP